MHGDGAIGLRWLGWDVFGGWAGVVLRQRHERYGSPMGWPGASFEGYPVRHAEAWDDDGEMLQDSEFVLEHDATGRVVALFLDQQALF